MAAEGFDLAVHGGRLHAHRYGPETDRLVVGVPGLSANQVSLERLAEAVPMVALDLRGRGLSEVTPPGSYGWPAHARDVLDAATALGHQRFGLVGWSMGAYIGMQVAQLAPERVERLVLIDAVASATEQVKDMIQVSVSRLGALYPSFEEYLKLVRASGLIDPWDAMWDRYYDYEMRPVESGYQARTARAAVEEDFRYGETHDASRLWTALTMPVLLLRASRPLLPGSGAYVIAPEWLERFREAVPAAEVVEVDANHYAIGTHPDSVAAITEFFAS
jgi:pimeloyl-ACP methyl ester carboxylesterase